VKNAVDSASETVTIDSTEVFRIIQVARQKIHH
jgi:hypothetical protein